MLQSVRVQRFKCIDDTTVQLGRVTVLVGPNNAGKSSVLHAVQLSVSVAQSLRLDNVAVWGGDRIAGTLSAQQLVYSPLRDVQALATGGVLRQSENQAIRITAVSDDLGTAVVTVRRGKNKNIAVSIDGEQLGTRFESIDEPFSVVAPGLAGVPAYEEFRSAGIVRRAAARGDANSVFRNILWTLSQDTTAWNSFHGNIGKIFDGMQLGIEFNPDIDEHISAVVFRDDSRLPIDSCGTGVLQAIQTLAYVDLYKPRLLILDEPDSHLHPDNQRRMARLLSGLAQQRDFQLLISTHSRHLLDEFANLDAKIHWFSGGKLHEDNIDRVDILLGLGALDASDRLRNGGTPFVVLTEDTDASMLRRILESSGLNDDECEVWSYSGCTNELAALVLAQFIREHAPNTRVIVHRDRDYLSPEDVQRYTQKLNAAGLHVFVTNGVDIESHFLNAQHLSVLVPDLPQYRIQEIIDVATNETQDKSIERLTNSRIKTAQQRRNKEGGGEPNYGQIAAQARIDYMASPDTYRFGKTVLGRVVALIQGEVAHNIIVAQASPHLGVPTISALTAEANP
ncbi:MAG: AAA family ATPase [Steroidobacter sp.]